jgi:hypothetical protein
VTSLIVEFGTGQALWSMVWFFLVLIWIYLLLSSSATSSVATTSVAWGKTLWVIFIIVLPYLGVVVYLIARGHKMQEHMVNAAQAQQDATRQYVQSVVGDQQPVRRDRPTRRPEGHGAITDEEFQAGRAKALAS